MVSPLHSFQLLAVNCQPLSPQGTLTVTNASLSAGGGFVVPISGNIMLVPGLPKVSRVPSIDVDDRGAIIGV
jgi:formate--tetrahydrofolate ligase